MITGLRFIKIPQMSPPLSTTDFSSGRNNCTKVPEDPKAAVCQARKFNTYLNL